MAKRRIVKLGTATLVVSLPSKWTKKFNLKQGDELNIDEQEKALIITTEKEFGVEKSILDITNLKPLINYGIVAVYTRGVDELEIRSEKPELIEKLQEKPVNQLIGYEIIEQSKNCAKIKDVSGTSEMEFEPLIRRIFLIINSMAEQILEAMEKGDTNLGHMENVDVNVNRFAFLCLRNLNKKGYKDFKFTPVMHTLVTMLETIGDMYNDLANHITEKKIKFSKKSIEIFKRVNQLYSDYQKIFFKFNQSEAAKLDAAYRKLDKEFDALLDSLTSPKEAKAIFYIENIAHYVAEMLRNQLTINL